MDLEQFRLRVINYRRPTGHTQKELAQIMGLEPDVLSRKFNNKDKAYLTHQEIKIIIKTLAEWEAINSQSQAYELLQLMDMRPSAFSESEWATVPLKRLEADTELQRQPKISPPSAKAASFTTNLTTPNNLQPSLNPTIGRERETKTICGLLAEKDVRLVTLTGTGGVGKTRLALQVGRTLLSDFPDGVFFVPLANTFNNDQLLAELIQVLQLHEQGRTTPLDVVQNFLKSRALFLILDNFEQVVKAAPLVTSLLTTAPALKILVTSRVVLHCYGEYEFVVPTLSLPDTQQLPDTEEIARYDSIKLFQERARAVKANFEITEQNAAYVAQICGRLEGLPLALELAASRIKMFAPKTMLEQLSSTRLKFLVSESEARPNRHRTIRATLEWSFDLLQEAEKKLFARLAVFAGTFSLQAAIAVASLDEAETITHLTSLVNQSMVQIRELPDDEHCFGLLETVREFALELLETSGEQELIRQRHAEFYLQLGEQAAKIMVNKGQPEYLRIIENQYDNFKAALAYFRERPSYEAEGLRLAIAVNYFWLMRDLISEGRQWLQDLVTSAKEQLNLNYVKAASRLALFARLQLDYELANTIFSEVLALSQQLGDDSQLSFIYDNLAYMAKAQSNFKVAREFFERSLEVDQARGDERGIVASLLNLGWIASDMGDYEQAESFFEQGSALSQKVGDKYNLAGIFLNLGQLYYRQHKFEQAEDMYNKALPIYDEFKSKSSRATILNNLGILAYEKNNYEQAESLLKESLAIKSETDNELSIASTLIELARVTYLQARHQEASNYLTRALNICYEKNNVVGVSNSLILMASQARVQGDVAKCLKQSSLVAKLAEKHELKASDFEREHQQNLEAARTAFEAESYAEIWQAGQALEVVDIVRSLASLKVN